MSTFRRALRFISTKGTQSTNMISHPTSVSAAASAATVANPSTAPRATMVNSISLWYHAYSRSLKTHPIRTKSITALAVGMAADVIAQACESNNPGTTASKSPTSASPSVPTPAEEHQKKDYGFWSRFNVRRAAAFSASCAVITAPMYHAMYQVLAKSSLSVFSMVLVDTFLAAPLWYSAYIPAMTYLSKGTFKDPKKDATAVKNALVSNAKPVAVLTLTVTPPLQAINFIYVPLHLRVVFMCAVDFFFTTGVSLIANRKRHIKHAPNTPPTPTTSKSSP